MLSGGIWGKSTGTVRVGRKTWEKTLVRTLEKFAVPETQADMAVLPRSLVPSMLSHFWFPFLSASPVLWAQPLPPFRSTSLSLALPCCFSHCVSQAQYPAQTVPGWLSCKSLADQSQLSHHTLSCSTQAAAYHQYKPSFAAGWITMGAPRHHLSLETPITQAHGLSSSHPLSLSH